MQQRTSSRQSYGNRSAQGAQSQGQSRGYQGQSSSQGSRNGFRSNSGSSRSFYFSGSNGGGSSFGSRRPSNNRSRRPLGDKIDIARFVQKASGRVEEKAVEITNSFSDFAICDTLKANLKNRNYATPTPIQDQAINHIIEGRDLIGLANTGTGKTAAFLLPMINKVYNDPSQKVLIIAPTRELALQIETEFRLFSWGMKVFSANCVGGMPIFKQIGNLKRKPSFVIGTPGRLKDLNERGILKFGEFQNIIIDEIDRMMDMGFINDIKEILSQLPKERQSLVFSATMPPKIKELLYKFLIDPITVEVSKVGETAKNVDQDIVRFRNKEHKIEQLQDLLREEEVKKVLIFIETKIEVERITDGLIDEGFKAESIHGDKKQRERQRALAKFKDNAINILVATDVAARGLDIKDISHVINYTIPQTYDDYVHRIGRTGRGMSKGKALTFVEAR